MPEVWLLVTRLIRVVTTSAAVEIVAVDVSATFVPDILAVERGSFELKPLVTAPEENVRFESTEKDVTPVDVPVELLVATIGIIGLFVAGELEPIVVSANGVDGRSDVVGVSVLAILVAFVV